MGVRIGVNLLLGEKKLSRAIFLDRDGVINRAVVREGKPYPPENLAALEILPGVPDAMRLLRDAGWLLVVVTNQPDVARGTALRADVEEINQYLQGHLPINKIYTCYHDSIDCCSCRKPSPGAILYAAKIYEVDLSNSYMIGDRWSDIEAGERAGCKTIFIDHRYSEKRPLKFDYKATSLNEAAIWILEGKL